MTEATLILVCKRPAPGNGKQQLTASLEIEMTQQSATVLLARAFEDIRDWRGPVVLRLPVRKMPNGCALCQRRFLLR